MSKEEYWELLNKEVEPKSRYIEETYTDLETGEEINEIRKEN